MTVVTVSERTSETPRSVRENLSDVASSLIVFSHLRWQGVYQRPQHLLSRFSREIPVVVVEEPMFVLEDGADPRLRVFVEDEVTVLVPILAMSPDCQMGFSEDTRDDVARLIEPALTTFISGDQRERGGVPTRGPIVWYYTPMAIGLLPAAIEPALVVFDAMDDLASFRDAPQALRDQESAMLRSADLVFAGGPSLYEARRGRHPSVYCFPSGVEPAHFGQAATGLAPAADLDELARPVLGFYGVLDERVDFDLIAGIADLRPDWTLAMVGPVAKIDPATLPVRPNIRYFGQQRYADLPAFLAGFDVALLPFAINEATRSISPTKTLEYLAADKPIVSTAIRDVVLLYGDVVPIATDVPAFVTAIDAALTESPAQRQRRIALGRAHLAEHDWDAIADGMASLMTETLATRMRV